MKPNIIGLDEAGRGAWAGSVYAGACIFLKPSFRRSTTYQKIDDSKKLTSLRREEVYASLLEASQNGNIAIGVGAASSGEIDAWGIKRANREAMQRALDMLVSNLGNLVTPECAIFVDGNDHYAFERPFDWPISEFIRGDSLHKQIGAASIIAKVSRDRMMRKLDQTHPGYGFSEHKGYGTSLHRKGLAELGPCEIHRFSYAPLQAFAANEASSSQNLQVKNLIQEPKNL